MLPVHQRLAELWTVRQRRPLSRYEQEEWELCLAANAQHCWKAAGLCNLSLAASIIGDSSWQHEICEQIEQLESKWKSLL